MCTHQCTRFRMVGDWMWVYNTAATIRQGARKNTDGKVLKAKLTFNWTGTFKRLAVGTTPASTSPGDSAPSETNYSSYTLLLAFRAPLPSLALLSTPRHHQHVHISAGRTHPVRAEKAHYQVPPPTTSQQTTSTLPLNALRSRKTRHINPSENAAVVSPSCTRHTGPDFSAPPANAKGDSNDFRPKNDLLNNTSNPTSAR